MNQPGKVANPARGQLNKEKNIPLSPCVPENLVSRDGFSRPLLRLNLVLCESSILLVDVSHFDKRQYLLLHMVCWVKKNLNTSRASEHPPVRGGNVKTFS